MTTQPPMPKNMMIFCVRAKILMPKTTNMKPMMLNRVATKKPTQLLPASQSAAPCQPMNWKVIVRPGSTASGAST